MTKKVFYRYMHYDFANKFISGEIRLSTLLACRNVEHPHADTQEGGNDATVFENERHTIRDNENVHIYGTLNLDGDLDLDGDLEIGDSQNAYILCLAEEESEELYSYFKTDTAVKILDLEVLCKLISSEIKLEYKSDKIQYIKKTDARLGENMFDVKQLAFSKPESYSNEKEWRVAWADEDAKEPRIINIGKINGVCEIVKKKPSLG